MARFPVEQMMEKKYYKGGVRRNRQCQSVKLRTNERCKGIARTGHDTCNKHSGARPILHGKYSKYLNTTLKKKNEDFQNDPELKSLKSEITLLRSTLADLLSNKVDGSLSRDEMAAVVHMCESIAKIAKTEDEITVGKRYVLTIEDTEKVISQVIYAVRAAVEDMVREGIIKEDTGELLLNRASMKLTEIRVRE